MDKHSLTVLLIEDSPQYARLVQQWLSDADEGLGFMLNWTDSLSTGMTRLERGGIDVILLDLGLPDCNGIETYAQTRARAPHSPILVLSSADSESLALQMIQEGAEDYLVKSSCDAAALKRAVRYAIVRRKSQKSAQAPAESRIIGVIGTKGGVGTTTVACNLASELRQQTGKRVLLADLDSDGGNVSFLAGLDSKFSIADAVSNLQRLDVNFWEALVSQTSDGLDIISSPGLAGPGPAGEGAVGAGTSAQDLEGDTPVATAKLEIGSLGEILVFIKTLYPWIVLDLGRVNQESLAFLDVANEAFVVTTTSIPALYNTKRAADALRRSATGTDRMRIIVNRAGETQALSPGELNTMFAVPVYATLPDDREELHKACVQKTLPGKNSHFRQAIAGLARKLTGLPERRRSKLTSLISLERFRRSADGTVVSSGSSA